MLRKLSAAAGTGLVIVCSCLVALVVFELILRSWFPVYDPRGRVEFQCHHGAYLGQPDTRSRQWTNTGEFDVEVVINQHGFRDRRDILNAGPQDILVVGDSFSFGQGVEEDTRYSSLVSRVNGSDLYNISIPNNIDGYINLLEYVKSKGVPTRNVIIGVTMENDLGHYPKKVSRCQENGVSDWPDLFRNPERISLGAVKNLMAAKYALYNLVSSGFQQSPQIRKIGIELKLINTNEVFQGATQYNDVVINTSVLRLDDIEGDYNLLVLVIPSRGLWQGDNQESHARIHDRFVELLAHRELDYVDLRVAMEKTGDPLSHHFPLEGHWNEKGHALTARELIRYLETSGKFGAD